MLTADRLSGLDARGAFQPWIRPVGGAGIGEETGYSADLPDAAAMAASGSRLLLDTGSGVKVYDRGQLVRTLPGTLRAGSLSGPFYLSASGQVRQVDGATYPRTAEALFGSRAAWYDVSTGEVRVEDVLSSAPARGLGVPGYDSVSVKGVWADHVLLSGTDGDGYELALLADFGPAEPVLHAMFAEPLAIGDGYALVRVADPETGEPQLAVWDFAGDQGVTPLESAPVSHVTTDGNSRVAYTTGSNIQVARLEEIPAAHTVALGVTARKSLVLTAGAPKWRLDVDANEALGTGELTIKRGSTTVATLAVPAEESGSVRLEWDGRDANGKAVPLGEYVWSLRMEASDGGEDLRVTGRPLTVSNAVLAGPKPRISSTRPVFNQQLTAIPGSWTPQDPELAFGYQWKLNGTPIPGATSEVYSVRVADIGGALSVTVTGSLPGYAPKSITSAATEKVTKARLDLPPPLGVVPSTATVDQTVQVVTAPWGPGDVALTYQWYKVSAKGTAYALANARNAEYRIDGGAAGYRLRVKVTGTKANYFSRSAYVTTTGKVAKAVFEPSDPTIIGSLHLGRAVSADPGDYPPNTAFKYKWFRQVLDSDDNDGNDRYVAIYKATRKTFTPTSSDLGKKLRVQVTASRTGYVSVSRTSVPTSERVRKLTGVTPKLTDPTPAVGDELGVTGATSEEAWGPAGVAVAVNYQWYRVNSKGIATLASTDRTYVVDAGDVGHTIKVKLVSDMPDWSTVSYTSAASAKVVKGVFASGRVDIDDSDPAERIAAQPSDWSPEPDSFTFKWYRNGLAVPAPAGTEEVLHQPEPGEYRVEVVAHLAGYEDRRVESPVVTVP